MNTTSGRFIVLEGGEGSGKSTQAKLLAERLTAEGHTVRLTREPGGTERGAQIRALLLHDHADLDERAELLLMLADRAQHVAALVRPAIERGEIVVSDRHAPSSITYQGVGRGLGVDTVAELSAWATGALAPDLVVVLDLDDATAEQRVAAERDRLEQAGAGFHRAVRQAYRDLAPRFGWVLVDATGTPEQVAGRVRAAVGAVVP